MLGCGGGGGGGVFYLDVFLCFPCIRREGQRFCSAPQLCPPSHPLTGAGCGANARAGVTAWLAGARGAVGPGRTSPVAEISAYTPTLEKENHTGTSRFSQPSFAQQEA